MVAVELRDLTTYQACILQARAYRTLKDFVAKQLEDYDVTMMEWVLLGVVHEAGAKGVSPSMLSAQLDVSLPMITRMLNKLDAADYISRRTVPKDKRQQIVVATAKGRQLAQAIEWQVRGAMREWLKDVKREDLEGYVRLMTQLASPK